MKKIALLLACVAGTLAADAQLSLSGTSYTQNFDNIGSGLPTGWTVRIRATPTFLGNDTSSAFVATPGATTVWNYTSGNFRNAASANGFANYAAGTTALQGTATDRALAVRQVAYTSTTFPGTDSGAAFVLQIANTTGLTNFNLGFKLQSLDSTIARVTTWKVDYGFGSNPTTFTQATTTGTMTTGGNTYSNNNVTVNFGSALNNNAGPVWIRIVALNMTTGAGSRPTTGIDDFNLTWTGSGATSYKPVITALSPADGATGVTPGANLQITFDRNITANAAGNIRIKNVTDQTTTTKSATSADVTISGKVVTVANTGLVAGKNYFVTFDSVAFDTAGYKSYGIYDTTAWNFATVPAVITVTSINEGFDQACATSSLPAGWTKQNIVGPNQQWNCYTSTGGKVCMRVNGFGGGGNNANEDWLITPKINLNGLPAALQFDVYKRFSGTELKALYSTTYTGIGDPNLASWTDFNIAMAAADTGSWKTYTKGFVSPAQPFFIAFKYVSTTADGYDMRLDSVLVNTSGGIVNTAKNNLDVIVVGDATSNNINLMFNLAHAGAYNLSIYDITGREVYNNRINGQSGKQYLSVSGLNLTNGMYIIKMGNEYSYGVTKAIVH
jgi:hypothetical protein